jgi:large subunit ribosomal protein L30
MNDETNAVPAESAALVGEQATVTVKLVRSVAGTRESHRATVRGLGLRKLGSESRLEDTPAVRGMINKVRYLVKVL